MFGEHGEWIEIARSRCCLCKAFEQISIYDGRRKGYCHIDRDCDLLKERTSHALAATIPLKRSPLPAYRISHPSMIIRLCAR